MDARARGIADGGMAQVRSRTGLVRLPAEVTDEMMQGVVSSPHGWGHGLEGIALTTASAHAGVSVNDLTDERVIDPLSCNATFSGVPVVVEPAVLDVASEQASSRSPRSPLGGSGEAEG